MSGSSNSPTTNPVRSQNLDGGVVPPPVRAAGARGVSPDAILERLDPEQREVATNLRGPLVVLAGAGTGKTRAITHRIAYGVRTGEYQPAAVLAVTFTTRAAGEMRGRLRELGAPGVQAKTFHAAARKQLSYFWPRAIGGPMRQLIEQKGRYIAQAARHIGIKVDAVAVRDLAKEIEWAKVEMIAPKDYVHKAVARGREAPGGYTLAEVSALAIAYEDLKNSLQLIDFEDLLTILGALLAEDSTIADQVRRQYRHFVVDEYQDVSPIQQFLLDQWLGGRDELCVVGDPSQTIYSYAGARPGYLLNFKQKYPHAGEVRLIRDYRSTPQVVQLANAILKEGRVEGALQLQAQRAPGRAPVYRAYDSDELEAAGIVESARQLISQGIKPSEIAVLYRTNAQSVLFEKAFSDAQIGYQLKGSEQFFARADVVRAITLLNNQAAELATDASSGAKSSGGASVNDGNAGSAGSAGLSAAMPAQVREILAAVGWAETPPAPSGAIRERWDAMCALVNLADELAANAQPAKPATLLDLVTELRDRSAHQHAPTINGVTLASLHSAKGLEWDAVFLAGMSEGLLPISLADTPEMVAEERRLLYVGVTRARELLEVSYARSKAGGRGNRKPSRFLSHRFPEREHPNRGANRLGKVAGNKMNSLSEADVEVFEKLRQWRAAEAKSEGKPAFTVLADTSLIALAATRPADAAGLVRVPGIGPIKLEKYGQQILEVLAASTP